MEQWDLYLTNPGKVIEDKYESLTKDSINKIKLEYENC